MAAIDDFLGTKPESDPIDDFLGVAKPPSALRGVADSALALTSGITQGVKLLSDTAGAGNRVSRSLGDAAQFQQGLLSPYRQQEIERRQQTIKAAEDSGSTIDEIGAYLGGFAEAPLDTTLNALGTSAPTLAAALLTRRAPALSKVLTPGLGAAQGVGTVKSSIHDATQQRAIEEGATEAEAAARADAAQAYSGPNRDQMVVGGILGGLAGSTGAERAVRGLLGGAAREGIEHGLARRVATGAAAEALPEAAQGGQERLAANLALQRQGYDDPLLRGVAGQAALEGIASAPIGGALAIPKGAAPPQPTPDEAPPVAPQQTVDPQTGEIAPPAPLPGDPIRAQRLPEGGPLTRGINTLVEAEAQAADAGAPVEAPVTGALVGVTPQAQRGTQGADRETKSPIGETKSPIGETVPAVGAQASGQSGEQDAEQSAPETPIFDPATRSLAPPPRATFDTEEQAREYLSKQRKSGGARQGQAVPVEAGEGRWTFARAGEPEFEPAQQAARQREADDQMRADTAFEKAKATLPPILRDMPAGNRKLYKLDEAIEAAKKPLQTVETISDAPDALHGTAYTPERAMVQATKFADGVKELDGKLRSGNRTGATTSELVTMWTQREQQRAAIEASRKASPDLWAAYDQRQAAVKALKIGDQVLTPYPSPEAPQGTPAKLVRKFGVNWRVETPEGDVLLVPPTALRPVKEMARPVEQGAPSATLVKTPQEAPAAAPTTQDTAAAPIAAPAPALAPAPVTPTTTESPDIDAAAHEAATSHLNERPTPTPGQLGAGNYPKGHTKLESIGHTISIETAKGTERVAKDGSWRVPEMPAHYGDINRTEGADGDPVDLFIGDRGDNGRYWVINQNKPDGKGFDEHKVVTGVDSAEEAVAIYKGSFADNFGEKVYGSISAEMDPGGLKTLLPTLKKAKAVEAAAAVPLTDDELAATFDEAAAEVKTQTQPPTTGERDATQEVIQPAGLPTEPESGTQGGQAPEAGSGDRVQRPAVGAEGQQGQSQQVAATPALEDSAARWTRSTPADRLGLLAKAGWGVNPPSLSTRRAMNQPWEKLTDSQRQRIAVAASPALAPTPQPAAAPAEPAVSPARTPSGGLRYRFPTNEGMDGQVHIAPPGFRKGVNSFEVTLDRTGGPKGEDGRTKFYPTLTVGKFRTENAARKAAEKAVSDHRALTAPVTAPAAAPIEQAPERDRTTATPDDLGAEISRLTDESRRLHAIQLKQPRDSDERAETIRQMDAIDRRRGELQQLLPDEDAADEVDEVDDGPYVPPDNWRSSMFEARTYARKLGIDPAGKELPALVKTVEVAQRVADEKASATPHEWAGRGAYRAGQARKAPRELSQPSQQQWLKGWDAVAAEAPTPPTAPPPQPERRIDAAQRKRVADMTADEMAAALHTDDLTGLHNARWLAEHEADYSHIVAFDADSLKYVNDNLGHDAGDRLLQAWGEALRSATDTGTRAGGDEFFALVNSEEEGQALAARVERSLGSAVIDALTPAGETITISGLGVSFGLGTSRKEADAQLIAHKQQREAAGARAGRGQAPPGTTRRPAQGQQDREGADQRQDAATAAEEEVAAPAPTIDVAALLADPRLAGVKVKVKAIVAETGKAATYDEDAGVAIKDAQDRLTLARQLMECLHA